MRHSRVLQPVVFYLLVCFLTFDVGAKTAAAEKPSTPLPGDGKLVFVQDFDLDAENFKADSSVASKLPEGPLPRPHIIRGKKEDPATQAQELVASMSTNLVKDLEKQGFTARRMMPGDAKPSSGWLLRGVFTEVDEGNRVRRAVIGFGSGAAKMSLYVNVSNVAQPSQALYEIADKNSSGKMPGAAITLNPIVAGAKFTLEKNASEKTVKKTASQIVAELVRQMSTSQAAAAK